MVNKLPSITLCKTHPQCRPRAKAKALNSRKIAIVLNTCLTLGLVDSKQFLKLHVCIRQLGNDKALPGNSSIECYQNF